MTDVTVYRAWHKHSNTLFRSVPKLQGQCRLSFGERTALPGKRASLYIVSNLYTALDLLL